MPGPQIKISSPSCGVLSGHRVLQGAPARRPGRTPARYPRPEGRVWRFAGSVGLPLRLVPESRNVSEFLRVQHLSKGRDIVDAPQAHKVPS
jgi:hypothetical protein